jgi:hypothetical protein
MDLTVIVEQTTWIREFQGTTGNLLIKQLELPMLFRLKLRPRKSDQKALPLILLESWRLSNDNPGLPKQPMLCVRLMRLDSQWNFPGEIELRWTLRFHIISVIPA